MSNFSNKIIICWNCKIAKFRWTTYRRPLLQFSLFPLFQNFNSLFLVHYIVVFDLLDRIFVDVVFTFSKTGRSSFTESRWASFTEPISKKANYFSVFVTTYLLFHYFASIIFFNKSLLVRNKPSEFLYYARCDRCISYFDALTNCNGTIYELSKNVF